MGFDPYDFLSSPIGESFRDERIRFYMQQVGRYLPFNIRGLIGIKKSYNPKALALMAHSYLNLFEIYGKDEYLKKAEKLIEVLDRLRAQSFENHAWGYNFPWANRNFYLPSFSPSIVVSSTVGRMLYAHYTLTGNQKSLEKVLSIGNFILKDLNIYETERHLCFSYTPYDRTRIFNASIMGAELLSYIYRETGDGELKEVIERALRYVLDNQSEDGSWIYGFDEGGKPIVLYDFHQGFVLDSISEIGRNLGIDISGHLRKGTLFYKEKLFYQNGMSVYRYPKKYPVDIHNQAQGIISFLRQGDFDFSKTIAEWTIDNMQDPGGYFYYQRWPFFINRIPYIRWGQAWMMMALSSLIYGKKVRK